jgi:DNA-directed RNA polymerase subunit RPC12/RpoP
MVTYDKCNICGWEGESDLTETTNGYECPDCGSEDLDDISADPYEDLDDEIIC